MGINVRIAGVLLALAVEAGAAQDLERQAAEAVAAHQLVEARNLYRQLAEQDPENTDYQIWVGRLSSWLSDYTTANATFDEVLVAEPGNVEALIGKAYVAMWQEQFAEAQLLLGRAEQAAPQNTEVHLALARNHHFQGQDKEATAHLDRVLAIDPGSAEAQDLKRRLAPEPKRVGFFAKLRRIFTGRS
jgi:tetratricopeptide (TPR) repeat protein